MRQKQLKRRERKMKLPLHSKRNKKKKLPQLLLLLRSKRKKPLLLKRDRKKRLLNLRESKMKHKLLRLRLRTSLLDQIQLQLDDHSLIQFPLLGIHSLHQVLKKR